MSIISFYNSLIWRLGRRLYSLSRNDMPLSPFKNGEYWLQSELINFIPKDYNYVIFDIGANIGEWTDSLLKYTYKNDKKGSIHLFEPAFDTYSFLQNKFENCPIKLNINNLAVSDQIGTKNFYISGKLSAVNTMHPTESCSIQVVKVVTIDEYISNNNITHIDFIKSDTEGFDCKAIFGAEKALKAGIIDIWQFEYNHRWIDSKNYLKDVFKFVEDKGYMVGKLCEKNIQIYSEWSPELERFFEANYVIIKKQNKLAKKVAKFFTYNYSNVLVPDKSRRFWWS